jgi:hypothetical protein
MGSLFFPQLSTGAMAQFPFSKIRSVKTVQNVSADGSVIASADPASARIVWDLRYNELLPAEVQAIQQFYAACCGPYSAFTFIDPADNMLQYSSDLTNAAWNLSPNVSVTPGAADPMGGSAGFTVVNSGQIAETIGQTVIVPANYQYCFSVYVKSPISSPVALTRTGSVATASNSYSCGPVWTRISSSGQLADAGTTLTAAVQLQPGQTIQLFGPQLEPQGDASPYRATSSRSGIYPNAHWSSNQLIFSANGPSSFASTFSIESVL